MIPFELISVEGSLMYDRCQNGFFRSIHGMNARVRQHRPVRFQDLRGSADAASLKSVELHRLQKHYPFTFFCERNAPASSSSECQYPIRTNIVTLLASLVQQAAAAEQLVAKVHV